MTKRFRIIAFNPIVPVYHYDIKVDLRMEDQLADNCYDTQITTLNRLLPVKVVGLRQLLLKNGDTEIGLSGYSEILSPRDVEDIVQSARTSCCTIELRIL
jgi:hypothetical protein